MRKLYFVINTTYQLIKPEIKLFKPRLIGLFMFSETITF